MRITQTIKAITPPDQLFEHTSDHERAVWLAGFESMRNAVLFLIEENLAIRPSWKFTAVDIKQLNHVKTDTGQESVQ